MADAPMPYRSLSFQRGFPDPGVVRLGAELGFNDVCFQTEGGLLTMLTDLRDRADRSGYFELLRELGMTCTVWAHEFADYDTEAWGPAAADNPTLWRGIEARYDHVLGELLPEIDHLVLTVVETDICATKPELLVPLVGAIRSACRRHGTSLILRSFVHHPHEFAEVTEAIEALPDDVTIMTKSIPQDWHMRSIDDPLIGRVGGRPQFVEVDIAGEYFRMRHVVNCFTETLAAQFARWREAGCTGLSVRVDRAWEPWREQQTTVLHQGQEANLWVLGALAGGTGESLDAIWDRYARARFGDAAAGAMAAALRPTGGVVAEGLYLEVEPFGEQKYDYAHPLVNTPRDEVAVAYADEEDRLQRNPLHMAWSVFRWDDAYAPRYHQMRRGAGDVIPRKEAAYRAAEASARASLARIEEVADVLPPGAYPYFRFKLEENLWHLQIMCEVQLAWLKLSSILYGEAAEGAAARRGEAKAHLERARALAARSATESLTAEWMGRVYHCRRGQYFDAGAMLDRTEGYWAPVLSA
jgi:hypothetical protein